MSNTRFEASPKKLRDGSWGAIISAASAGNAKTGDTLRITTKSGKSWEATIAKVIWTGSGKAIVSTRSSGGGRKGSAPRRSRWCNCGMGEDPMSMGFAAYAGQIITCPSCGGKIDVC